MQQAQQTIAQAKAAGAEDKALIEAAADGDYAAFEKLVIRYRDRVYRLARGMTRDATEAEEVVQDAFLNLFRNLGRFRGESAPGSWIYRIAVNSALMRLRTKRRKPLLSVEDQPAGAIHGARSLWPAGDWSRGPESQALDAELKREIERSVDDLPEKYRLVLLFRDVEGMSNQETADALGLTVATVKTRLHRARLMVRGALAAYFEAN